MSVDTEGQKFSPAYTGYGSWKNYVGDLANTTIPPRIDKTMMDGKSGSMKAALLVAFHFFGLIDKNGKTTERLRSLAKAHGTPDWSTELATVIEDAYRPIVEDVPLKAGTAGQLHEAFKEHTDLSATTRAKAISFYLKAAKDAKIELSPHFKPPSVRRSRKRTKAEDPDGDTNGDNGSNSDGNDNGLDDDFDLPEDWVVQPFNVPGRDEPIRILMPSDLTAREWKMVSTYIELYVGDNE